MQCQAPLQRSYQIDGYTDCAHVDWDKEDYSFGALERTTPDQLAKRCKSSDLVFPQKLHMLLTAAELDEELARSISWQVHGRAFIVHDRKLFVRDVLPKWFLQSRFESFQRQLNLYGFRRITAGPDRGACYHELFLRQRPVLASRVERIRLKGKGPRKPAAPDLEPNFYRMTILPTHAMKKQKTARSPPMPPKAPRSAPAAAAHSSVRPPAARAWQAIAPAPATQQPNALGALMMRPWAYHRMLQQPLQQYKPELQPRAMPVASSSNVVSAPASPAGPILYGVKPPMPYRTSTNMTSLPPPPSLATWMDNPNERPQLKKKEVVPRCVSHLKLDEEQTTAPDEVAREDQARKHKPAWNAGTVGQLPTWAEAAVEDTNDEDFAAILFELASS